jgi:hypothetical protein
MNTIVSAGLLPFGALLILAAPASAEPASTTIDGLRAQGLDVRVDRVGNAPLSECTVSAVRALPAPAQPFLVDDDDINVFTVTPKQKVAVSLDCAG